MFILHGLLWVNHILQGMISAWIVLPTEFIERPALGYAIGIGLITTTFTIGAWAVTRVRAAVRRPLLYVWWLSVSWMTIPIYVFFYRDFIEISVRYFIGILFPSYMHPIFLMASVAGWVVFPFAVARNLHTCGIDARQPGVALVRRVWTTIWVLLLIPIALYGMFEIIEIIRARSNLNS